MMKFKAKKGKGIPPGLMSPVEAVQWHKMGDHLAVTKAPSGMKHASGSVVEVRGEKHFSTVDVDGIVRITDELGLHNDYIVLPGYWIITNPEPDNKVWSLSPELMSQWFEKA